MARRCFGSLMERMHLQLAPFFRAQSILGW